MQKITTKLWTYGISFLVRAFLFDLALGFSIAALVFVKDGFTIWAILAVAFTGAWFLQSVTAHLIFSKLDRGEKALYFGLRRFGTKVVQVHEDELKRRSGQNDSLEILRDTDSSLEIQMLINGTFWLINIMIGIKWLHHAIKFNNNEEKLVIQVVD